MCEVVSPITAAFDRRLKLPAYARAHVSSAWIVDPLARTVEVLARLDSGLWSILATHSGDDVVRVEPFDGIDLELAALWTD